LFQSILPRHVEIIFEINARFMTLCFEKFPNDLAKISRLSIIDESGSKYIRMANLACVGSHHINGVAALHSELLKEHVLHDFFNLWPNKFLNVTNGVTPRRWVALSNKALTKLITNKIGDNWIRNYQEEIRKIEPLANDPAFCQEWADIKYNNKVRLATWIKKETDIDVDPNSIFDIQVKRIHEYKRQHLNALHIIAFYNKLKANPNLNVPSRTFIFGGKAAPGYFMAKRIIKLINSIGDVVNNDPEIKGKIKVVFLPNFNVQTGHFVYPASDLSEQISTAGKEASGTGNMKFAMNGALTVGTLDGANVEIRDEVGHENFFLFGLTTEQVYHMKSRGYDPAYYYHNDQELKLALDQIANGYYSNGDTQIFKPLVDSLLYHDEYMLLADFRSYVECQDKVDKTYLNKDKWVKMSILNVARMGKFSSDRSIKDYSDKIWGTSQVEL
nr:glycogen/starch/alpha-glucan family phosphorylase [Breznakibacter sp.]